MMWMFADTIEPEGKILRPGDMVVATLSEFGDSERKIGIVVATDGDDCINVMILPTESDI